MLFSFWLLSLNGLLSGGFDQDFDSALNFGMRLGGAVVGREFEESDVPLVREGSSGSGDSVRGGDSDRG